MQKNEIGFLSLTLHKTQDRNQEVGIKAEAVEEHCLPTGFLWLAQLAFFFNPGPPEQWHVSQWTRLLPTNY